ncbi:hypothetical protein HPB48_018266 [Haemaphysalis longicornis]|uniref:Uncharacterized protein n=1 Tax=Haemaphysalis longicornis TaxID=44386 RepID=A0A9J6FYG0_HAELO|nr:hypothetical protein HPB48_018266 [Haemaphysalis longicornis]
MQGRPCEVRTYHTAQRDNVKDIIQGIPVDASADELHRNITNDRNPLAGGAKGRGSTTTIIVAFKEDDIPIILRYEVTLIPCRLYREQIDVCHPFGLDGHHKNVWPTPSSKICRASGFANFVDDHLGTSKCKLCGGAHPTASTTFKDEYRITYIVRKRQWESRKFECQLPSESDFPPLDMPAGRKSRAPSGNHAQSKDNSCKRSQSRNATVN